MSVPPPSQAGIVTILAPLFAPGLLWSWGRTGHRVSAMMAESRLTPAALAAVRSLLEPGESLADASTWADEQREVPRSGPWHYVNVPISEPRYDPRFCSPEGCVVSKVEDFERVLSDPRASRAEKQQALRFLVHFIQDLHQPLHVGDTGSRGGNLVQVRFFDVGTNLHRVWDSAVIEWHSTDEANVAAGTERLATPQMAAAWSKGSVEDWATESLAEAKLAYCLPGTDRLIGSGTKLGEEYCRFALPIIQLRLAQSAVRLAATSTGFSSDWPEPEKDTHGTEGASRA